MIHYAISRVDILTDARNELFVTAGANKTLSFYREASGT